MATDTSRRLPGAAAPDWTLPDVLDIQIRHLPFTPREHKYFRSALADRKEATEFLVRMSGPVPARALGPALFVGDTEVAESAAVEDTLYRFLAFEHQPLKPGAVISWGWLDAPPKERKRTKFRFKIPRQGEPG